MFPPHGTPGMTVKLLYTVPTKQDFPYLHYEHPVYYIYVYVCVCVDLRLFFNIFMRVYSGVCVCVG